MRKVCERGMRERDMRSTMTARATTNDVARITAEVAALEEEALAEWEEAMSQSHAANRAPLIESPLGIPYVEPTCPNIVCFTLILHFVRQCLAIPSVLPTSTHSPP
jgi:hypothetical protein